MNVQNKTLRVLGTIGGVLFSIVLIFALIGSLFFSVTASLVKPETIMTLAKEYSLTEQVMGDASVNDAISQEGIPTELVNDLLDSPFFKDTVEAYTNDVVAAVQGKQPDVVFNEQTVKQFAEDHMDSLVGLVKKHAPEDSQITDDEIQTAVRELADEYATILVEAMPSGEQVREMLVESEIQKPMELLVSTTVPVVLYTIICVLAAIIFVCLLHKFRGLLCLGIDALIAAVPLFIVYLALSNEALIASMLGESATLAATLIAVLVGKLGVYLILLTLVGVLFIAGYITYTVLMKKKAAAIEPEAAEIVEPLIESVETAEET